MFKTLPIALIIFLLCASAQLQAQPGNGVHLSQKHINKIEKLESAKDKLKKYRKFYHKDSLRYAREVNRYWKKQYDSLWAAKANKQKAWKQRENNLSTKVTKRVREKIYKPWAKHQAAVHIKEMQKHSWKHSPGFYKAMQAAFEQYFLLCASNDSMLVNLRQKMPELQMPKQLAARAGALTFTKQEASAKASALKGKLRGGVNDKLSSVNGVKEATELKEKAQEYSGKVKGYKQQYSNVLQSKDSLASYAAKGGQKIAEQKIGNLVGAGDLKQQIKASEQMKGTFNGYKTQAEQLQDSAYIKEQAKKKAEEMAMNYLAENPQVMNGVRTKMALLMKKYSVVPNSNDLSTATKRTSLKGRMFRERLVFAANFQVLTLDPVSIDFSPSIGYKLNSRFVVGAGGTYRQTFSTDSLPGFSPDVLGYKVFSSYDILGNFFAYGEYDRNTPGIKRTENGSERIWKQALLAGIGRKFSIHKKIEMTLVVAYNFLHENHDPVYPRPWVVRVGFQTSQLAMMKRRPVY